MVTVTIYMSVPMTMFFNIFYLTFLLIEQMLKRI